MSRHGTAATEPADAVSRAVAPSAADAAVGVGPEAGTATASPGGRRVHGLSGWPIRRKLAALVAVPVAVILVASGVIIGRTWAQLSDARAAGDIAALSIKANQTSAALQRERSQTVIYLRTKQATDKATMEELRRRTDEAGAALRAALDKEPAGGWSDDIAIAAGRADDALERLPSLRNGVSDNQRRPELVISSFSNVFEGLQSLTDSLSTALSERAGDQRTKDSADMLSALTVATAAAAEERDILTLALEQDSINERRLSRLSLLRAVQQERLAEADKSATKAQHDQLLTIGADDDRLDRYRDDAIFLLPDADDEGVAGNAEAFTRVAGQRLDEMNTLVSDVAEQTRTAAASAENRAWINAITAGLGALATLVFVALATMAIGRTITDPLRRLRSGAVDVATTQLPTAVARIEAGGGRGGVTVAPVLPPGTKAGPETVEVAAAVDGLTATAVRLATAQTELRRTLDEAFVNMSRRSQTMVEKQLGIIDELESTEQDPDQLRNLFRLDHLAARMRRYNDNLLVLAGAPVRTRSSAPIAVAELFRAATSEMEQYERVRLVPTNGVSVVGTAAGGLVHLLAELLDNAAMYSPPTSPITLASQIDDHAGLVIEVRDSGVGIPAAELQRINARLDESDGFDLTVPSRMGLFVVGRLARRGGFSVHLLPRSDGTEGIVAQVRVPAGLVLGLASRPSTGTPRAGIPAVGTPASPAAAPAPGTGSHRRPVDTTGGSVTESHDDAPLPRRQPRSTGAATPAAPAAPAAAGPGLFGSDSAPEQRPSRSATAARLTQGAASAAGAVAGAAAARAGDAATLGVAAAGASADATAVPASPLPTRTPSGQAPAGTARPINAGPPTAPLGQAPQAWDTTLPTELAARASRPDESGLIGLTPDPDERISTPIFDSISVWFEAPSPEAEAEESEEPKDRSRTLSNRWAALGDQRWIAANARAAAAPDTAGTTTSGLPMRRPGANLLPTAATIAPGTEPASAPAAGLPTTGGIPAAAPVTSSGLPTRQAGRSGAGIPPAPPPTGRVPVLGAPPPNAEAVRGRLGSYQRGLSSARQARRQALAGESAEGAHLFSNAAAGSTGSDTASDKGGDQ